MKLTLEQAYAAVRGLGQLKAPTDYVRAKAILDLKRELLPHIEPINVVLKEVEDEYRQAVLDFQEQAKANPEAPLGIPLDVEMTRQSKLQALDAKAKSESIEIEDSLRIPELCVTEQKVSPQTLEDLDPVVQWRHKPTVAK